MEQTLSENTDQNDSILKYIFPPSTAVLRLILLFACIGAVLSPYLGFVCEQDEVFATPIQIFRFLTLLSWPIVIIGGMIVS